jgi:hypothetical protein
VLQSSAGGSIAKPTGNSIVVIEDFVRAFRVDRSGAANRPMATNRGVLRGYSVKKKPAPFSLSSIAGKV